MGLYAASAESLIMETFRFNPAEKGITKLTEQLNIKYHLCLKYLCSEQHVVGIFSTATRQLRSLNDFCTFQPEYRICDKDFFEKLKNNPPISYKTAEALMQITPSVMLAYFSKRLIGQQHELKKIVYTFYEYLQNVAKDIPFTAPNWILTAPSGCGKTEVYRILRDFCKEYKIPIPVIQVDLTQYTEAGYKGKDLSDILKQIIEVNKSTDGTGICFLDEADKKFVPSIDSKGTDYNAALQANLLTFVEGNIQTVELDSDTNKYTFDTSKTMFVFMGAFQNIRDKKQSKHESKSVLGFGANIKKMERTNKVNDCFYDNITLEDMLEIGMLEELAGRLEQVINLHRIPEEDMLHLLREKTKMIAEEFGIDILMSENARKSFLEISYSSLGIRRPLYCIRSLVRNTLANAFFNEKFDISQYRVRILSYGNAKLQKKSLKRGYTKSV